MPEDTSRRLTSYPHEIREIWTIIQPVQVTCDNHHDPAAVASFVDHNYSYKSVATHIFIMLGEHRLIYWPKIPPRR